MTTTPAWALQRRATFRPKRLDTLRPRALAHIGETYDWAGGWVIEEGDYQGQVAWIADDASPFFGWVPDEDLEDA